MFDVVLTFPCFLPSLFSKKQNICNRRLSNVFLFFFPPSKGNFNTIRQTFHETSINDNPSVVILDTLVHQGLPPMRSTSPGRLADLPGLTSPVLGLNRCLRANLLSCSLNVDLFYSEFHNHSPRLSLKIFFKRLQTRLQYNNGTMLVLYFHTVVRSTT